ncbi:MAG: DMT family transporter [Candidatus Roizmanbacteria bacterium]|nr:DMT family transporter [Candidatus Roizmanbacteria bacterium]
MLNKKTTSTNKEVLTLLIATFLFSLFGVFTRAISDQMGVFYQLSARVIVMSIIFLVIGYFSHSLKKIRGEDFPLFILRGFLIIFDFSSFFVAVNNLPLGLTLFLFYAASVAINFMYGTYFLHEKINATKIISLILAFVGLISIYVGGFHNVKLMPSIFALISGTCFGLTTATSKKLTDEYSVIQVNLVAYLTAAIIGVCLLFTTKEVFTLLLPFNTWLMLLCFAAVGVVAFYLTLYGFSKVEAQKGSLVMLAELIFVVITGFVFYHEVPTLNVIIGGICILLALALPNLNVRVEEKRK